MDTLAACLLDRGYRIGPRLGLGFYAEVIEVTAKADAASYAAKVYRDEPAKRAAAAREVEAMASLSHPRLPKLSEWFDGGDWVVLVMDFVPGANLRDEVAASGPLPMPQVTQMGIELCKVFGHIAAQGWTYRDLHVKNVHRDTPKGTMLLDLDGARPPGWPGQPSGRSGYRAPELERGMAVTPACDVYSLAGCLYFALTGDDPPDRLGQIPDLRRRIESAALAGLLDACRAIEPLARPAMEGIAAALRRVAAP